MVIFVEIMNPQNLLNSGHTLLGEDNGVSLFIDSEMFFFFQSWHYLCHGVIKVGSLISLPGYNQRGPGLINQNTVYLIHNSIVEVPLDHVLFLNHHIIPKVIETKLIIGSINNIGVVGRNFFIIIQPVYYQADRKPQKPENLSHPLTVPCGQVIVYSYNMDSPPGKSIKICRQCGYKGFTFTGLHFRYSSLVKDYPTYQLDIKMPHSQHPF